MLAVLTGDIVHSRSVDSSLWLPHLKELLSYHGEEPRVWEIFRGDSFQLRLDPEQALQAAIRIKAGIRQIRQLDVRIAIGIGEESYTASRISESNGSAYVRSGECFDDLKKQNLGIKTGTELDETMNLMMALALLSMNGWSNIVGAAIRTSLENPNKSQSEVALLLERSQSSVSEALSRGGFEEVLRMISFYQKKIRRL